MIEDDSNSMAIIAAGYEAWFNERSELIQLYWEIGRDILQKQREEGWGTQVIARLAKDLKVTFPQAGGFSIRNLSYMKQFAAAYPDFSVVLQTVARIPWGHNIVLLTKVDSLDKRIWYAHKTIAHEWSRSSLKIWIECDLYGREHKPPD